MLFGFLFSWLLHLQALPQFKNKISYNSKLNFNSNVN
jgi:hypothetical protein